MLPVAKPNTINPVAEVWISAESEPRSGAMALEFHPGFINRFQEGDR